MLPKSSNVFPPKPGTPIPYICQDCKEHFTAKKTYVNKPVKCPKCGSIFCRTYLEF